MKPHLLLLPGLLCDPASWGSVPAALAAVAHCHVADYGAADSITAMAQGVLRDAPEHFSMAGHSMGGRVALEIVRLAPHRVDTIALLDTGHLPRPIGPAGEVEAAKRHELLALARSQGMRTMGAQWAAGMVAPNRLQDVALMDSILAMIERKTPDIFAAQIKALLDRPDASAVLSSLQQPLWLICGRQDSFSPVSQHEAMAQLALHARLCVLEDCGHMSAMEQPEAMVQVLRDWLVSTPVGLAAASV
jgi:pimeloyl-ACP methyl ester carboxylesterase